MYIKAIKGRSYGNKNSLCKTLQQYCYSFSCQRYTTSYHFLVKILTLDQLGSMLSLNGLKCQNILLILLFKSNLLELVLHLIKALGITAQESHISIVYE